MRGVAALSFAACAAAAVVPSFSTGTIHDGVAPILSSSNADAIPNRYIIKFKKHVTDSHAADHHTWLNSVHSASQESRELELRKRGQFPLVDTVFEGLKHTYKIGGAFTGYAGHFDDATIEEIRRHPDVSPTPSCSVHRREHHLPFGTSYASWQAPSVATRYEYYEYHVLIIDNPIAIISIMHVLTLAFPYRSRPSSKTLSSTR